jgi:hypothetical protein
MSHSLHEPDLSQCKVQLHWICSRTLLALGKVQMWSDNFHHANIPGNAVTRGW